MTSPLRTSNSSRMPNSWTKRCATRSEQEPPVKRKKGAKAPGRKDQCLLDPEKVEFFGKQRQERDATREIAFSQLHSLKASDSSKPRIPQVTSLLNAPRPCRTGDGSYQQLVPENEPVYTVQFFTGRRKIQEFLVLGSQPLTALRDGLYCATDGIAAATGLQVPSGFFLINDVFYNDFRHPEAVDYSEPFIRWAAETNARKKRRRGHRHFQGGSMADTCFMHLKLRPGARYLYVHQGSCKHEFVITDVRLLHPDDPQEVSSYPVLRFLPLLRHRKCSICDVFRARKVTYNDKLAPSNPCYFCEDCYSLLHYDKSGFILDADFRVFEYQVL